MTGNDILKFFFSCVIVALIVAAGYFGYEYWTTPSTLNLGTVGSMQNLAALPPMQCTVATAGFDASHQGVVYIDAGQLRADIMYEEGSEPTLVHTLVTANGIAYRWNEGATQGIQVPFDFSASAFDMKCQRWWKPDSSLFTLPLGVTFASSTPSQ